MRIGPESTLDEIAAAVGSALKKAEINAVLTGGACATLYSGGEYQSVDLDFILSGGVSQERLESAMRAAGFKRVGDRYVHPKTSFFVEFPRGPLSIGRDAAIRPVKRRIGKSSINALSPTDSCRDRLAAFYFWDDLSALDAAAAIARRHDVDLRLIRRWSQAEGQAVKFEQFKRQIGTGSLEPRPESRIKSR